MQSGSEVPPPSPGAALIPSPITFCVEDLSRSPFRCGAAAPAGGLPSRAWAFAAGSRPLLPRPHPSLTPASHGPHPGHEAACLPAAAAAPWQRSRAGRASRRRRAQPPQACSALAHSVRPARLRRLMWAEAAATGFDTTFTLQVKRSGAQGARLQQGDVPRSCLARARRPQQPGQQRCTPAGGGPRPATAAVPHLRRSVQGCMPAPAPRPAPPASATHSPPCRAAQLWRVVPSGTVEPDGTPHPGDCSDMDAQALLVQVRRVRTGAPWVAWAAGGWQAAGPKAQLTHVHALTHPRRWTRPCGCGACCWAAGPCSSR
jgi:hypothetical protein